MELKPGYKQTDAGIIPSDWDAVPLRKIGDALIGLTYRPEDVRPHGTLVLRASNIQNDKLAFDDNVYVGVEVPEQIMVRAGDVLVCVRNGSRNLIGKAALLDKRCVGMTFGAFMAVHRGQDGRLVNYLFQSDILKRQINEHLGATINQITNRSLNAFRIPFPPTDSERESIGNTLSDVDALLDGLDRLIAKKRDFKQAAMQQLLTGRTRLPGFKGKWEAAALRQIIAIPVTDGPHMTPAFLPDGVPFLSVNNLVAGRVSLNGLRHVSRKDHMEFSRKCCPIRGDILLGKAASVGLVALVDFDWEFNVWSPIAVIRLRSQHVPAFFYYSLQARYVINQIKLFTNSSSQGNIGMGDIEALVFSYPDRDEQAAIAKVLSDMDAELSTLNARREKTHLLKQAIMQQLLTGRTRLVDPKGASA